MSARRTKRQKVSFEKTEEEKQLEADLFGTLQLQDDVDDDEQFHAEGLTSVLDENLFFVDDSVHGDEDKRAEDDSDDDAPTIESTKKPVPRVWTDPTVVAENVPLVGRTRKLRQIADENSLQVDEYENRLRDRYTSMNPGATSWANKARKRLREMAEEDDADLFTSTAGILRRKEKQRGVIDSGFLNAQRLRDPNLAVSKLSEGGNGGNGEIKSVAFHPSPKIPILCVASADRRVRLFNTSTPNPTDPLTTLHIPTFPIQEPGALFVPPSGSSLLLTSPSRPYWWIWDLNHGSPMRKDINFASYSDLSATVDQRNRNSRKRVRLRQGGGTMNPTFSTSGDLLACSSNNSNIFLLDWARSRTGIISSFKCSGPTGSIVKSIHFVPKSFAPFSLTAVATAGTDENDSLSSSPIADENIAILTSTGLVYIYDISYPSRPLCVRKWGQGTQGGSTGGWKSSTTCSAFSRPAGLFSVGTNSGYIDIYSAASVFSTLTDMDTELVKDDGEQQPKPSKSISNLKTPISSLHFSHDGKLLCAASKEGGKGAWRVIHTQTLTTYTNFPSPNNPPMKGGVTSFAFSPTDEFLTVGDVKGRAAMWRIAGSAAL